MKLVQFYFFGFVCGSLFSIIIIGFILKSRPYHPIPYPRAELEHNWEPEVGSSADWRDELHSKVRVLCWVLTSPKTLYTKAIHVRETWGRRCNKILFFSSLPDKSFPAIGLPVGEGRSQLFNKTSQALEYLWKHHAQDADWFLKADDDTFVIVENLRYLLARYNSDEGLYFGHRFKTSYSHQGYMSGGAGYVLSRKALQRFVWGSRNMKCPIREVSEDVLLGLCLHAVGVKAMDSRDSQLRQRFFPFQPKYHLIPQLLASNSWFWQYSYYETEACEECCSKYTISFHYISAEMMHVYNFFVYNLKVFGEDFNKTEHQTFRKAGHS